VDGICNPFIIEASKAPHLLAAFLCPSFSAVSIVLFCYGGLSWAPLRVAVPRSVLQTHCSPSPKDLQLCRRLLTYSRSHRMTTQTLGEIRPIQTGLHVFFQEIFAQDIERKSSAEAGIPALLRLVKMADRDTGQSNTVRQFLLGLYNGYRFPFNLIKLRGLDKNLFDDCMLVLTLDARVTAKEIHLYIDNGGKHFERWAKMAGGAQ